MSITCSIHIRNQLERKMKKQKYKTCFHNTLITNQWTIKIYRSRFNLRRINGDDELPLAIVSWCEDQLTGISDRSIPLGWLFQTRCVFQVKKFALFRSENFMRDSLSLVEKKVVELSARKKQATVVGGSDQKQHFMKFALKMRVRDFMQFTKKRFWYIKLIDWFK